MSAHAFEANSNSPFSVRDDSKYGYMTSLLPLSELKAIRGEGKGHPVTCHAGTDEGIQKVQLLTPALGGGEWLTSRSACFNAGKETRYPLNRRLDGAQDRSEPFLKLDSELQTSQAAASHYTDCAIAASVTGQEVVMFSSAWVRYVYSLEIYADIFNH